MKKLVLHFFNGKITVLSSLELAGRLWLGYTMIINSPVGITISLESLGLPPDAYQFIKTLWDSGFMMQIAKSIELLSGICLVLNLFVPLALVVLLPVLINILGVGIFFFHHSRYGLEMLGTALFIMLRHLDVYRPMLQWQTKTSQFEFPSFQKNTSAELH